MSLPLHMQHFLRSNGTLRLSDMHCIYRSFQRWFWSQVSHCVGRSGYDRKMANEETLIFFVRKMEELDKPFVTLEYSIKRKEVLQCYAYDNEKPEDKVLEFVNNKWLPYANHQLEQLAA